jgi:hypothetical protein
VEPFLKVKIVQETKNNVPVKENDAEDTLPEHIKLCAELSLSISLGDNEIKDRVFHLLGGTAVFGVCIGELDDSFLVAASCQLVSENGKVDGKPFSRSKIIRLMRTSVTFITIPESEHRYYFYKWLKKQFTNLPSFFSQDRRDIVENFVYAYENRNTHKVEQNDDQISDEPELQEDNTKGSDDSFWSPYTSMEFH